MAPFNRDSGTMRGRRTVWGGFTAPMDHDWSQIYLYVATMTYRHWNKGEMPADIAVDSISNYQMGELNRLKLWLYHQRVKARQEKDRAERRQKKEDRMMTEEKESQEFSGEEKVYPHPGVKLTTRIAILLGCIIGIVPGVLLRMYAVQFCEWLYDIALTSSVNNFRNLGLGMVIAFSACFVGYLIEIFMGYSTKEIALSQEGVVLARFLAFYQV